VVIRPIFRDRDRDRDRVGRDDRDRVGRDDGSAAAEFVMVAALLTVMTLSVLQLALALHVRNTVLDAAAEGARFAALAGSDLDAGVERTRQLIRVALGEAYAVDVRGAYSTWLQTDAASVTVRTPLPLLGLVGPDGVLEVSGHAAVERVE